MATLVTTHDMKNLLEEVRLKVMTGDTSPPVRSALVVSAPVTDDRECYNCGRKGHLSYSCPQPRNPGRGRTGGGGRGAYRGARRGGRGRGRAGTKTNLAATDEGQFVEISAADVAELEELRHLKLRIESSKDKGQATQDLALTTAFGNFANYAHAGTGEANWEEAWDWHQA